MHLPTLLSLTALAAAGKPGQFNYYCRDVNCDTAGVDRWLEQACRGIGGGTLTSWGKIYGSTNGIILGGTAICLCARDSTKDHDYDISGPYPPGTAELRFSVGTPMGC